MIWLSVSFLDAWYCRYMMNMPEYSPANVVIFFFKKRLWTLASVEEIVPSYRTRGFRYIVQGRQTPKNRASWRRPVGSVLAASGPYYLAASTPFIYIWIRVIEFNFDPVDMAPGLGCHLSPCLPRGLMLEFDNSMAMRSVSMYHL